jgi:CMP/dCMP kinase
MNTSTNKVECKLKFKIIAADGTAGSGKSSICNRVSQIKGWSYINTGAIYRAIGWLAYKNNIPTDKHKILYTMAQSEIKNLTWNTEKKAIFYKNSNIAEKLISETIGLYTSTIAKDQNIRTLLLPFQQGLVKESQKKNHTLIEGRDIGTVVCPNAHLKFFITAEPKIRALRRLQQTGEKHPDQHGLEKMTAEISQRDRQDRMRKTAPLIQAEDAIVFNTGEKNLDETIVDFIEIIEQKLAI